MLASKGITAQSINQVARPPYSAPLRIQGLEFENEWNYVDTTKRGSLTEDEMRQLIRNLYARIPALFRNISRALLIKNRPANQPLVYGFPARADIDALVVDVLPSVLPGTSDDLEQYLIQEMTLFDGHYQQFDLIKKWNQLILQLLEADPALRDVILPERKLKQLACNIL